MKNLSLVLFFLCFTFSSFAQNSSADSLQTKNTSDSTAKKMPSNLIHSFMPSLFSVHYDQQMNRKLGYQSKDGEEIKMDLDYVQRIDVNATLPLFKIKKKHGFAVSVRYQTLYSSPDKITIDNIPFNADENWSSGSSTTLSYGAQYKIKKKTITVSSSISFLGENPLDVKRISGLVTANLTLKKTPRSVLSVGLVGLINAKSTIPVAPTIAYFRQVSSKVNLELILPALMNAKYIHSAGHYSNFGFRLDGFNPFFSKDMLPISGNPTTSNFEFRNSDIKFYTNTQYHLTSNIWFSAEVGYAVQIQSKMIEKGDVPKNYILDGSSNNRAYFNIGILMRPKVTLELLKKMAGK